MAVEQRDPHLPVEALPLWRIPLARYHELIDAGIFDDDDRAELLEGVLVEMSPKGVEHDDAVAWLTRQFVLALDDAFQVRPHSALTLESSGSEPEPDLAIVAADAPRPYHPGEALLVIEAARSSLAKDRLVKARLYARAGVPEYWVVNLGERRVERHAEPQGDAYTEHGVHRAGDVITPRRLGAPPIEVGALFAAAFREPAPETDVPRRP